MRGIVTINGKTYALNYWDGEKFLMCYECLEDDYTEALNGKRFTISPIYEYENGAIIVTGFKAERSNEKESVYRGKAH